MSQAIKRGVAYKRERDDGLESSCHDCGVAEVARFDEIGGVRLGYSSAQFRRKSQR
jgi:hypothetical protein